MSTKTIIDVIVILKERLKNLAPDADAKTIAYIVSSIEKLELQVSAMMLIEFGDEQVEAIKTESAAGLLLISGILATEGAALKVLVEGSAKSLKQIAVERTLAFKAFAETTTQDQLDLIDQAGKSLIKPKDSSYILEGANPFLLAKMHRYDCSGGGYTTEMGQFHNASNASMPFKLLAGIGVNNRKQTQFAEPPRIEFVKNDSWALRDQEVKYAYSGNIYNYPAFFVSAMFLSNTTDSTITRNLSHAYSNYGGSYAPASVSVGTPNAKDGDIIDSITWALVEKNTSSHHKKESTVSIQIPAGRTVVLVKQNPAHYFASSSGYQFIEHHEFYNMKSFLGNGLEINIPLTLACQQKPVANDYELWN